MNFGRSFQGKELDPVTYKKLRDIHLRTTFPPVLRGVLMNELFQSLPEFRWLGKVVQPSNWFSDIVQRYWMPFMRDVLDEIFTLGIVVVRLQKLPGSGGNHIVPVVISESMGFDYTVVVSKEHNMKRFTYYKLRDSKKNGFPTFEKPKKDPKVYVFSGFGYDPDYSGVLNSILAGSVGQDAHIHSMYRFAMRAEFNVTNPTLITETTPESQGIIGEADRYDSYVTGDRVVQESNNKFLKDERELAQLKVHQDNYFRTLTETTGRPENPLDPPTYDVFKKQQRDNMFPLPTNHKLVNQQLPSPIRGSDWETLNRVYQDTMSAVYVVPRGKVFSDTGTTGTSAATSESVEKSYLTNIKKWKSVFGEILTATYRCIYAENDCFLAMKFYTNREIEDMSEDQFIDTVTRPRVEVSLPIVPRENMDELLLQYVMKVIDWPTFKQLSIRVSGYSVVGEETPVSAEEDPWDDEHKMSIINTLGTKALSKTGMIGEEKFPKRKEPTTSPGSSAKKTPKSTTTATTKSKGEKRETSSQQQKKAKKTE